jgi:histidinol-phosphate aminotransferase
MFRLEDIVRKNIKNLIPYSSARNEFNGSASVYLDANENSFGSPLSFSSPTGIDVSYNRYPDPYQSELKKAIGRIKKMDEENIFLGNGSDECIDLLFRCFCEPRKDNVVICPPTYGMYEVSGNINDVEVRKVPLRSNFQLDSIGIEKLIDHNTKIVWLCSPNNPTGTTIERTDIFSLLKKFSGIVVLDEAYIDFSGEPSFLNLLEEYPNLVVLQTFSKAWALAGLRLGMAFASREIICVLNKVKPPYNINSVTQDYILKALVNLNIINEQIASILQNRSKLAAALQELDITVKVFASDANFLLVKMKDAKAVYQYLLTKGIVVRDRSNVLLCENCLRITVGTTAENNMLMNALKTYTTQYEKDSISR